MAISNATINRLGQLSSILNTAGTNIVNAMQNASDKKLQNASNLINTYYTNEKTGRVAQTINNSTRENLKDNMQKLQTEIGELDTTTAKQKIAGLGDFDDAYVGNALNTFKDSAGTYLATSYIQGQSALEQQYKNNAFTAFDSYFKQMYSDYSTDATNLGDVTNANANFDKIFNDATVDKMIQSGYLPESYREDSEAFLEEYKAQYGEKWAMQGILYTHAMTVSTITTDFTNALSADFTIDHATNTFLTTTTDKNGNTSTEYLIDGATSYARAKEQYDTRYASTDMSVADPNGLRKSGTITGDTAIWTYTSDAWLYNYGYYTAENPDWVNGDMEATAKGWAEQFLASTSLSADEQKILVEEWISLNFDASGNPKDGGQIASGLAQASQDSTSRLNRFVNEVDATSFGKTPTAEDMITKMEEYGFNLNNAYDLQNATNYLSAVWGFSVESTDLAYADELSVCRETIASIPHGKLSEYNYGEISYGGETIRTNYYEQIENMYDSYLKANNIENASDEYKFGFFKAVNNAINSGVMELSSTLENTLKDQSEKLTYDEYVAYCSNLRVEGELPTNYAYQQALALAPVEEYKSEQSTVEGMIKATLKQALDEDASNFYMTGVDNYPEIRREINEKLVEFGGDINSTEFQSWLKTYTDNMISAYSAEFNERTFKNIINQMTGYGNGETTEASSVISEDSRTVFYQYKQGNYDGIVDETAVSHVLAELTHKDINPDYETVRDIAYEAIYPNGEGFDKATDAEKANTLLALEIATLTAEEQRNIETTFGEYFDSPVTPVRFEGGKQAYLLSPSNSEVMVVWNESIYDNTYMVGLLRGERSIDEYDSTKGGARTYLKWDDIANAMMYQRTVSGALDLRVRKDYEVVDEGTEEPKVIDEEVVNSAYNWATTEHKYPQIGEITQYMSDNVEDIDSIVQGLKDAVKKTGYLYQIYADPYTAIDELASQVMQNSMAVQGNAVQTTVTYTPVGKDGNFQSVLQKIGHKGKGITL